MEMEGIYRMTDIIDSYNKTFPDLNYPKLTKQAVDHNKGLFQTFGKYMIGKEDGVIYINEGKR